MSGKFDRQINEFDDLVTQLKFKLHSGDSACLTDHCMTPGQFFTGCILRNHINLTMSELAEKLHTSLSTVTGLIDRMVKNKYVERNRVDTDRRLVKVRLSKKGIKTIDKMQLQKMQNLRSMLSVLNEKDRVQYLKLMRKLVEGL